MLPRLAAAGVLGLVVAMMAIPSAIAGHDCHKEDRTVGDGTIILVEVCEPHDDDGPGTPPPEDGEPEVTCSAREDYLAPWDVPPDDDGSYWVLWPYDCSDGSVQWRDRCVANCPEGVPPAPSVTIPGLRLEALSQVDPPLPGMRHSFDQPAANGQTRAIVLAETWWWAEGSYDPIVVREDDGPLWVEVIATPGPLTIDPGDGTGEFTCPGPGLAFDHGRSYYDQVPGEPKGACVHVYEDTFDTVTATMTVTWELTWQGYTPSAGTVGGTLEPIVREQQVSFPVRELQSVIVY